MNTSRSNCEHICINLILNIDQSIKTVYILNPISVCETLSAVKAVFSCLLFTNHFNNREQQKGWGQNPLEHAL